VQTLGEARKVFYFDSEGRENLDKTLELVLARIAEQDIEKVVVFTRDGEAAVELAKRTIEVPVIAVTFPYKQRFLDSSGESEITPPTSNPDVVEKIRRSGIRLVRGTMPFQSILIPYVSDPKLEGIIQTLKLFGGGLSLCVQAILMATDAGDVEPGQTVIGMSADTAIVATGALSHWLFHPYEGMEIREIICKPKVLTVSRPRKELVAERKE